MRDRIALGLMARAPSDAGGKTRLVRALELEDGSALRRAILLDTVDALRLVRGVERVVLFTPDEGRQELAGLLGEELLMLPQRGETLGARLTQAFDDLFAEGFGAVALVGSDLPTLPPEIVDRGVAALRGGSDPLVLGPAADGGYYFIGLRRRHPELFEGIRWSTPSVLAETLAVAGDRLAVTLLPEWYDVDSREDLHRALDDTRHGTARAGAHLRAWAAREPRTRS